MLFSGYALAQESVEVFIQLGHSKEVNSVAFSPDGERVLSGSRDETIKLWDAETGREIRTFSGHNNWVNSVAFSPDGQRVLSGSRDNTLKLWDTATGREIRTFSGHDNDVNSVVFSPDGQRVLSGSGDNTIKLWDAMTGREIHTISGHSSRVTSVAFSPDGERVLSGSRDETIKLWDAETGREIRTFSGHSNWVYSVAFSPDGQQILSGSGDKTIKLWDEATGREIRTFSGHSSTVISVTFTPDGQQILSGSGGQIKLWDAATGRKIHTFSGFYNSVRSVAFSPDGQRVFSGGGDFWEKRGITKFWDAATGREIRTFSGHSNRVNSVAFSPDAQQVLSGSEDDTLKLWDAATGREIHTFSGHNDWITSVAFSPDGQLVLSGSDDNTLKLWDAAKRREIRTFSGHSISVSSVAFSPDGQRVLSGSSDITIKLWDTATGREIRTFSGHSSTVYSVAFSPDGQRLLSGSWDDTMKLWDAATGREIRTFSGHSRSVFSVAFSPDGQRVLSGSGDNTIKLWDAETGREVRTFSGHNGQVLSVAFSPDGQRALSGSGDGTTRLWDVKTGQEIAQMITGEEEWVTITPEGYFDASQNGAEFINVRIGNEVFSMDNFFDTYYRPDIVQAKLAGEDISKLIDSDIRNVTALPPSVRFTTPESNTTSNTQQLTLTTEITDRGGGIDEVRLFHNGKLVSGGTRGLKLASGDTDTISPDFEINLLPGENTFRLTAFSEGERVESNPAELVVKYDGAVASSNLYVLAVGVNEYKNTTLNLNYGRPDAEAFTRAIERQSGDIFQSVNVTALYDGQATRAGLQAGFEDIIASARPQDTFLFFYAGHGVMSEPEDDGPGDFYMALSDVVQLYGNNTGLQAEGISAAEMTELTRRIPARKQMIVLDACQSGGAVETFAMRGAAEQKAIMQLARSAGLVVMASTGTEQFATEFGALGHGVFTYALLDGLSGKADGGSKDGKITVQELNAYLNDQVPELTQQHRGQSQYPNSYARGQDFPISIVRQ